MMQISLAFLDRPLSGDDEEFAGMVVEFESIPRSGDIVSLWPREESDAQFIESAATLRRWVREVVRFRVEAVVHSCAESVNMHWNTIIVIHVRAAKETK